MATRVVGGSLRPPSAIKLHDVAAERSRQEHHDAIRRIQLAPFVGGVIVLNQQLANGVTVTIDHGLGREPLWWKEGSLRGATSAGYVIEIVGAVDRSRAIQIQANGFGATITVNVAVA